MKFTIDFSQLIQKAGLSISQGLQVLITLDTTGSMYSILDQARRNSCKVVDTAFSYPNAEVGFIAHGDYEDEMDPNSYVTRQFAFTKDSAAAKRFIGELGATHGYDFEECIERVLFEALQYKWSDDANKLLVVFTDAIPHEPNDPLNTEGYDWRKLATEVRAKGIQVVAVQCLNRSCSNSFFEEFTALTDGIRIKMNRFSDLEAAITAAIAKANSPKLLEEFEVTLKASSGGRLTFDMQDMFDALAGRSVSTTRSSETGLKEIDSSRFQEYTVSTSEEKGQSLKDFVSLRNLSREFNNGKEGFKTGLIYNCVDEALRGKAELRANHEVVLHHKPTGMWYSGDSARIKLGCPKGSTKKLSPNPLGPDWEVWKQSTSSNRKMKNGTRVLVDLKNVPTAVVS